MIQIVLCIYVRFENKFHIYLRSHDIIEGKRTLIFVLKEQFNAHSGNAITQMMANRNHSRMEMEQASNLFDAVAIRDHELLITEFIKCSRNALVTYHSLKKNWQCEMMQGEQNSERKSWYTYTSFLL
jgi:hypothetical protein